MLTKSGLKRRRNWKINILNTIKIVLLSKGKSKVLVTNYQIKIQLGTLKIQMRVLAVVEEYKLMMLIMMEARAILLKISSRTYSQGMLSKF